VILTSYRDWGVGYSGGTEGEASQENCVAGCVMVMWDRSGFVELQGSWFNDMVMEDWFCLDLGCGDDLVFSPRVLYSIGVGIAPKEGDVIMRARVLAVILCLLR